MAFSRYRSPGRRTFSPRFRRRRFSGVRQVTSPKRWEVGRIDVALDISLEDPEIGDDHIVVFVPLAQIFDRVGDATTGPGRALSNFARKLEVGGLVLDYSCIVQPVPGEIPPPGAGVFNGVNAKLAIASDRLFEDGSISALTPNFWSSTTPTSLAANQTLDDEDQQFPMRIHYEDTFFHRLQRVESTAAVTGAWPNPHSTVRTSGRTNLRLKLALDDFTALGFYLSQNWFDRTADFDSVVCQWRVNGKIYYRVRF